MAESYPTRPLHSWKEISAYLGCDKRTAQRWEKERGLPVHHLVGKRGSVYAYASELDSWVAQDRSAQEGLPAGVKPYIEGGGYQAGLRKTEGRKSGSAGVASRLSLRSLAGGHALHIVASCLLYASLYALTLVLELTYDIKRFRSLAVAAAAGTFVWILVSSLFGLLFDYSLTQSGRHGVFAGSLAIFFGSAGLAYLVVRPLLPDFPAVVANFQTYTVQAAYLKDICYFLLLLCLFWFPPFHFVAVMEHKLAQGQHGLCLALLMGNKESAQPERAIYPKPKILFWLWVVVVLIGILMLVHLFDNLRPAPHLNLFMQLVLLRTILYFVFGTGCLVWYYRALDRLKHTCREEIGYG